MAGLHLRYPTSKLGKDMIDELLKRFCTAQKRIDSIKVSKVNKKKVNRAKPSWGKKESRAMPSWNGEVLAVQAQA